MAGRILLFYKYVDIQYPEAVAKWHLKLCKELGLTGRVIVAHEGINGTLGGSVEATQTYIDELTKDERFGTIDFKEAQGDASCFPRMRVVVKDEIVRLGLDTKEVHFKDAAEYLTPEQAHDLLSNRPDDLVVLDARNNYESRVGMFRDSITPDIKTFREFPDYVLKNKHLFEGKQVVMHCTGGVRCERASAFLQLQNIAKKVYHIEGGIHRYTEKFPDGHFRGSNYVFDARVTARINNDILGTCDICNVPWDQYINCVNAMCNKHFLGCPECVKKFDECCGQECYDKVRNNEVKRRPRPFKGFSAQ